MSLEGKKQPQAPLDEWAFRTYLPDPSANASTRRRYAHEREEPRVSRKGGGLRSCLALWAQTLMRGVLLDDLEMMEDAMAAPLWRGDARVAGGANGAPFSFSGSALVSRAQVSRARLAAVADARKAAEATRRHYSATEWANIEQHVTSIASVLPEGACQFQRCVVGDTALHLATRQGSLRCASRLLLRGYDPLSENADGETSSLDTASQLTVIDRAIRPFGVGECVVD